MASAAAREKGGPQAGPEAVKAESAERAQVTGGFRNFKDKNGRIVQAKVVKLSATEVVLESDKGGQMTLSLTQLSKDDQDYLELLLETGQ